MVELHIVPDSEADENGEPHASLGHNGPPPDVLPPSDARPSEVQAEYCAAINGHINELMAVALARAGTKKWGASFHRTSLLGVACDIEVARKLPAQEETSHEKDRRQWIKDGLKDAREERDKNVHIATMMGDPELARNAIARYDYRVSLLEAEFAYPARTTTFRFIAGGVLRDIARINQRAAHKIPTGFGASGVIVALVAASLRRVGVQMSDELVRTALEDQFKNKRAR